MSLYNNTTYITNNSDEELSYGPEKTFSFCVKQIIVFAYTFYAKLLQEANDKNKITIACGGQSPAYYCLAMLQLKIYNPKLVNIIILPYSRGGIDVKVFNIIKTDYDYYSSVLNEANITSDNVNIYNKIVIIDGVHSGVGIKLFSRTLDFHFKYKKTIICIAINSIPNSISKTIQQCPISKEYILSCEHICSDVFPRIIMPFHAAFRRNTENKPFNPNFIDLDNNYVAQIIINISKDYPEIKIQDTDFYKSNLYTYIKRDTSK